MKEELKEDYNARMAGKGGVISPKDSLDFRVQERLTAEQLDESRNAHLSADNESVKALKASLTKDSTIGKKENLKAIADTRPSRLTKSLSRTAMPTSPDSNPTISEPGRTFIGGVSPDKMKGVEKKTSRKIGLDTIKSKESMSVVGDVLKGKGNVKKKGLPLVGQSSMQSTKYKGLGTLPEVPSKETPKVDKDVSFLKSKAP